MKRILNRHIPASVATRESFRANTVRGASLTSLPGCGRLHPVWCSRLEEAFTTGDVVYVVFSYATPIAWHTATFGWVVPDVFYTPTTLTHQWYVQDGIGWTCEYGALVRKPTGPTSRRGYRRPRMEVAA